jgi:hypothetical protein
VSTGWLIFAGCLALLPLVSGCVWRTQEADHLIGPAFYRLSQTAPGQADIVQTLHVPLLLEGGRQWGLSLGVVKRDAIVPGHPPQTPQPPPSSPPYGILTGVEPRKWHFTSVYFRAPLRETPLFIRRTVIGTQGGGGVEQRAFSLGYSSVTATWPREHALHELEFDSRHPLEAKAVVTPAADMETTPTPAPRNQ